MEPKSDLTSVDLRALETEWQAITDAILDKAYYYPSEDLVRLKMRHYDVGRIEFIIQIGEYNRAHRLSPEVVPDAPGRPPQFAKLLRSRLEGATLEAIEQYGFDRIITLTFERGDEQTQVIAELFGDGNVVACEPDGTVLECLETVRLKSRTVAAGQPYEYPEARVNPLELDRETFREELAASDTDVVRTLATQFNLGGLYAEEVCTRAGVEKTMAIEAVEAEDVEALFDTVESLRTSLETGALDPRVYRDDERPLDATPLALEEYEELDTTEFDVFEAALETYYLDLAQHIDGEETAPDAGDELQEEIEKQHRIIEQQTGAIEEFEAEADRYRERAESLYAHYDRVAAILETVAEALDAGHSWEDIASTFVEADPDALPAVEIVETVDGEAGRVVVNLDGQTIRLDPDEDLEHNADRLYREAKSIEDKRAGAKKALAETRERLEALEAEAKEADQPEPTPAQDKPAERTPTQWLSMRSIPIKAEEQWYEQFRWFHTSDEFLVIGGRSAEENEALVKKYMEPGDRFFHAQAHGGPATILKATGPSEPSKDVDFPERTLEEAAQFALSYSSVWKAGHFSGDVYMVSPEQVTKTPQSGEFLETGGFAITGDRTYFEDVPVGVAVGIICEPETRVVGGPPTPITDRSVTAVDVEPGRFAQEDVAKRIYRQFRDRFEDTSYVRKVASPDLIGEFLPPGTSRIKEDS